MSELLRLYAVRNATNGTFFAKKSCRLEWVELLDGARLYAKRSQARGMVTRFSGLGIEAELVELVITKANILDESDRVLTAKRTKLEKERQRDVDRAKLGLEEACRQLNGALEALAHARGGD